MTSGGALFVSGLAFSVEPVGEVSLSAVLPPCMPSLISGNGPDHCCLRVYNPSLLGPDVIPQKGH